MLKKYIQILKRKRKAETLLEVIVAIFILTLGSGAATVLIVSAMRANTFSKDNLIALNLAVEGIEAVRNIRDTNWIKYGFDKENCWNLSPEQTVGACAPDVSGDYPVIAAGEYVLNFDTALSAWRIDSQANTLDLTDAIDDDPYQLFKVDFIISDSEPDLILSESTSAAYPNPEPTPYYRMITIGYPAPSNAQDATEMTVTSLVQWRQGGQIHQIELNSILTNYQKVEN
ncbi:hypothetical protein GF340_04005 [Candidatus Peregrinibacteria bacterium]|nr:hypothetical protein [Candidatus Peregrinibacteria bacterium]